MFTEDLIVQFCLGLTFWWQVLKPLWIAIALCAIPILLFALLLLKEWLLSRLGL